jgi:polar amino acid transport system substrate-binding protein
LTTTVRLTTEEYGIGFRKNSNLVKKLNNFMDDLRESGKLRELAVKYGVQEAAILE